jgi:hypothetical protein
MYVKCTKFSFEETTSSTERGQSWLRVRREAHRGRKLNSTREEDTVFGVAFGLVITKRRNGELHTRRPYGNNKEAVE